MESIGEKLRRAREEKGFSHDQVARDTHIAKRFIVALENEDFPAFPGEPYLLGFVRNYADFLGLDAAELIALYRNIKLQEQPAPMEVLLEKPSPSRPLLLGGAILVLVLVGGILGYLWLSGGIGAAAATDPVPLAKASPGDLPIAGRTVFREEVLERPFAQGEEIAVVFGESSFIVGVETVGSVVVLRTPVRKVELAQGQSAVLDLVGDRSRSVKVSCTSILTAGNPPQAVLRFDRFVETSRAAVVPRGTDAETGPPAAVGTNQPTAANQVAAAARTADVAVVPANREQARQVILEAAARNPFTVELDFRALCMLRFIIDGQAREEKYFRRGETLRTDVRGEIRLWYSNGGAVSARIAGRDVQLGRLGEVGAGVVRWVRDEGSSTYRLEFVRIN